MKNYDSPARTSIIQPILDPYDDEMATSSPTSTVEYDSIEDEVLRFEMSKSLKLDQEKLAREVLRHKADSLAKQARLLREESKATEAISRLEGSLKEACDRSIACRIDISKLREAEGIRYIKFEVKALNLKVWEYLLQDPDCHEIYAQAIKPRTRPFGDFSHIATGVSDWVKLRHKLEWIEKVLVLSEPNQSCPETDKIALKKVLKKKADAIHRFNILNDIIFEEEREKKES